MPTSRATISSRICGNAGLFWLAPEGGLWTTSGPVTVQNSINNGSFYYKTFMLHEMAAGAWAMAG